MDLKWSIGRHPPEGLAVARDLQAAVEQTKVMARTSGIGGVGGRMLNVWRRETTPKGFTVQPVEQIGRGGILASTLHDAIRLRREADQVQAWPESNRLVIVRDGERRPISKRDAEEILERERTNPGV